MEPESSLPVHKSHILAHIPSQIHLVHITPTYPSVASKCVAVVLNIETNLAVLHLVRSAHK
jgi:hypothetical protein